MVEKKLMNILIDYLRSALKKYIPLFWLPVVGDKLLDKVMALPFVKYLMHAWAMFSLM